MDAPEVQSAASLPARLALAELLANRRGADEQARAAYDQLAKDYADRWEVEEGRGTVRLAAARPGRRGATL